ncbi:MAG: alpha/beta fold hydrolase [Candidatus Eremiobacteraeota bacterium]|nr:alpha/beta fold hydrolase [Candidatus Eremiobacteraeota bacterium]MCW5872819.1 alpha/beta fold hydrolase [Candidatus Eremiobacteraeota bacterium]
MQITSTLPTPVRTPLSEIPRPSQQPSLEDIMAADNFEFQWTGQENTVDSFELPAENAPKLQKPVLLVHGFNSGASTWTNMHTWLVRDGANQDGGVISPNSGKVDGEGRVFAMQFSRACNSLANNAAELRQAIDRISAATGSPEVDVVGHSMGGLDARAYIDQGNEKVDHLVMLATPNHGSVLADLDLKFREWGLNTIPREDDPLIRQSLRDLGEVREGNNPNLALLNQNFDRQKSRAKMLVVAGNGRPTLASRYRITIKGEGTVSRESASLPNVPLRNIWGVNHGGVKDHPDALRMTAAFLTDAPLPMDSQDPPNVPADRDITPLKINADGGHIHYFVEDTKK